VLTLCLSTICVVVSCVRLDPSVLDLHLIMFKAYKHYVVQHVDTDVLYLLLQLAIH